MLTKRPPRPSETNRLTGRQTGRPTDRQGDGPTNKGGVRQTPTDRRPDERRRADDRKTARSVHERWATEQARRGTENGTFTSHSMFEIPAPSTQARLQSACASHVGGGEEETEEVRQKGTDFLLLKCWAVAWMNFHWDCLARFREQLSCEKKM